MWIVPYVRTGVVQGEHHVVKRSFLSPVFFHRHMRHIIPIFDRPEPESKVYVPNCYIQLHNLQFSLKT